MSIVDTFESIIEAVNPTVDENGFPIIEGARRSFKYDVFCPEAGVNTYVFAATPTEACVKVRAEFKIDEVFEVTARRRSDGEVLKYRLR